jgi:hypothetical protein
MHGILHWREFSEPGSFRSVVSKPIVYDTEEEPTIRPRRAAGNPSDLSAYILIVSMRLLSFI